MENFILSRLKHDIIISVIDEGFHLPKIKKHLTAKKKFAKFVLMIYS